MSAWTPQDVQRVYIITDGCFSQNYAKYEKMWGKKVVWMLTENADTKEFLFGRKVSLESIFDRRRY